MTDGTKILEDQGFQHFVHTFPVAPNTGEHSIEHSVFHAGAGPALILMHETPGLAKTCVDFAKRLIKEGFEVYMPHLVGPLMRDRLLANSLRLCVSAEFARLSAGKDAPIANWLRSLARRLIDERGQQKIGAIGMCLTGAFAIPLLIEDGVEAVVASQPGVPAGLLHVVFGGDRSLGPWQSKLNISNQTLADASNCARNQNKSILIQRFSEDRICPAARTARLAQDFGDRAVSWTYETSPKRPHSVLAPHSVLTYEFDEVNCPEPAPADDPTQIALARVIQFFNTHLKA